MRYLLKFLQRAGLVSVLLIGGVLGGLMAPLSADAAPTLTLQIDNQEQLVTSTNVNVTGNSILGAKLSACSAADRGLGYTDCYAILTSTTIAYKAATNNRLYRIQNAPGATARLRVGDNLGQDYFSLVGVQFVPVNSAGQALATVTSWSTPAANTNEQHILKVIMRNKFDASVNINNATGVVVGGTTVGQVAFAIASGGEFRANPLAVLPATTPLFCGTSTTPGNGNVRCSTVGDNVVFTGRGIFSGAQAVDILSPGSGNTPPAANSQPLSYTVPAANAGNSIVGYDGLSNPRVGQTDPTYPRFDCRDANNTTKCQPDITLTMAVTLKGPDTFVLLNGQDGFCAICNVFQDDTRLTRLITFITAAVNFLDWWENTHADNPPLRAFIDRARASLVTFNSPPSDPVNCPNTKFIQGQVALQGVLSQQLIAQHGGVVGGPSPELAYEYRVVYLPGKTWEEARAAAQALDGGNAGWDLATITSAAEQATISALVGLPPTGEGTVQYWVGGFQQTGATEPGASWQWINGEGSFFMNGPISGNYENFDELNVSGVGVQPDNGGTPPYQNHLSLDNRYGWGWDDNDFDLYAIRGYVAERVAPPVILE
jgi:hypothetical protein